VFEVKHLNSKTMSAYEKSAVNTKTQATTDGTVSPKLIRLFALYENLVRFVLPLCSTLTDRDNPRTPITQSNNIVDISGVGLKQFWNLRAHMQDASTLATAHYPETLDRIFVSTPVRLTTRLADRVLDHRRTSFLSNSLGMDKEVVRSYYNLENLYYCCS